MNGLRLITTDFFESNIYLFEKNGKKFMVDCGGNAGNTLDQLKDNDFIPDYVLLTHGHIDHISSLSAVAQLGSTVLIHPKDAAFLTDSTLNLSNRLLGKEITFTGKIYDCTDLCPKLSISVLHTPGHTPGSVCYLVDDILFSGDTLFCGGIGNTMFPGGNYEQEICSIHSLLQLPEHIKVYPGHGNMTTILNEKHIV